MDFGHLAITAVAAALSTFVVGFIYYHPKIFGTVWMRAEGLTEEKLKTGNMAKIFGLSFLFAFLMGFFIIPALTIHQIGALGMIGGPGEIAKALPSYSAFMNDYGTAFRSFKHGALHGAFSGILFIFPILAINNLYSRKSFKLTLITAGYWVITLAIMGGIICGWTNNGFTF